jgi:hypothetical protein
MGCYVLCINFEAVCVSADPKRAQQCSGQKCLRDRIFRKSSLLAFFQTKIEKKGTPSNACLGSTSTQIA